MKRILRTCALLALGAPAFGADSAPITDAEVLQAPTPARLEAIFRSAQRQGWSAQTASLRTAATGAYRQDRLAAAESWFLVGRWAGLFSESPDHFLARWTEAVQAAHLKLPEMPRAWTRARRTLGEAVSPELQEWLIGQVDFSAEFFALLSPLDYAPGVLRILDEIHLRDPAGFARYPRLALALAVVYDVPPPGRWPHAQVSPAALPRAFPAASAAFAWWTQQDRLGHTYHPLDRLSAEQLKFVVDAAAPFAELEWSRQIADYPLPQLARLYAMIPYRQDRLTQNRMVWPGPTYRLSDILAAGGICVDQAYFATEAAKARGVPTVLFFGHGDNGRHAWFGFLDHGGIWRLDAGRGSLQRLVPGFAYDPQTWNLLAESDIRFLSEPFRGSPAFHLSRVHAAFAQAFLQAGETGSALAAARRAVAAEQRNPFAWATLLDASHAAGVSPGEIARLQGEAKQIFLPYPTLEAVFAKQRDAPGRERDNRATPEIKPRGP